MVLTIREIREHEQLKIEVELCIQKNRLKFFAFTVSYLVQVIKQTHNDIYMLF